jgi:hypothetical protein
MKSIVMPVREQLKEENKNHPGHYREHGQAKKETAGTSDEKNSKPFTVQEMWRHRRQARSASDMMRRWNMS